MCHSKILYWLYYNLSSDCRRIINRQYSNLSVLEKTELRAENLKKVQRQKQQLIETLQYQNQQLTLYLFADLLNRASSNDDQHILNAFDLPEPIIDFNDFVTEKNKLIREELKLASIAEAADAEWNKLNDDQRLAADKIINAIQDNEFDMSELFFLNDSDDTSKIFVQNIVMTKLRSQQSIVLAVASFDIAATLLDGDQTAHARFKISLNFNNESICNIKKNTNRAALLKTAKLIFWDEALMQRKYDMLTVSRTLSDICDVKKTVPFDDKMICFCDDFRQCLSVCPCKPRDTIIATCLLHSPFWKDVIILRLTINMRLRNPRLSEQRRRDAARFVVEMLKVDNATTTVISNDNDHDWVPWRRDFITNNTQTSLIRTIYSDLFRNLPNSDYLNERAILTVINVDVDRINTVCVKRIHDNLQLKYSVNEALNKALHEKFPLESFHSYDEPSLSSHVLRLKINMSLMILRNLTPSVQCNDTRMRLTRVTSHVLKTEIISGKCKDELILIPRIPLNSKNDENSKDRRKTVPCQFKRHQFSVRPVFVMTVNKSQDQSLRVVDIDIRSKKCFTHDQLYVALSKVTNMTNLFIITSNHDDRLPRQLKNIQWKQMLLSSWSMIDDYAALRWTEIQCLYIN